MRIHQITSALIGLVSGALLAFPQAALGLNNEFWFTRSTTVTSKPALQKLNVKSRSLTTMRRFPFQGPNSENIIPNPSNSRMAFYGPGGIFIGGIRGGHDELVVTGDPCHDGPCDEVQGLILGSLSAGGRYLTYQKGTNIRLLDLQTNIARTVGNRVDRSIPSFSPRSRYLLSYSIRDNNEYDLWLYDLKAKKWKPRIDVVPFRPGSQAMSPDERFVAIVAQISAEPRSATATTIYVYSTETRRLVSMTSVVGSWGGTGRLVWLSSSQLAFGVQPSTTTVNRDLYSVSVVNGVLGQPAKFFSDEAGSSTVSIEPLSATSVFIVRDIGDQVWETRTVGTVDGSSSTIKTISGPAVFQVLGPRH